MDTYLKQNTREFQRKPPEGTPEGHVIDLSWGKLLNR